MSLCLILPCGILPRDDRRDERRPNASSTSRRQKKKPSSNTQSNRQLLSFLCGLRIYLPLPLV